MKIERNDSAAFAANETACAGAVRRGRPRKAGPREPNGRLKRSYVKWESERRATAVAIKQRRKHYGLTEQQATRPEAATEIGRLLLREQITAEQYDAAVRYREVRDAYLSAIGTPGHTRHREDEQTSAGLGDEDAFCRQAVKRFRDIHNVIRDFEAFDPAAGRVLEAVVMLGYGPGHHLPILRDILQALWSHTVAGGVR